MWYQQGLLARQVIVKPIINVSSIIDSTPIRVCHNRRIHSHSVFAGMAVRGKTSLGWFYGFKLHLIIQLCSQETGIYAIEPNKLSELDIEGIIHEATGKEYQRKYR